MKITRFCLLFASVLLCSLSVSWAAGPVTAADALHRLVEQANQAAAREDYPVAIQLYEQIVRQAPQEAVLKSNLAVLYANHGVRLQEQKQFEQAIAQLDKAMALSGPKEQRNITQAKANTYFAQAIHWRDTTANPQAGDFERMRESIRQAQALLPDEAVFNKGMASLYLDEAYRLAVNEQFEQAIPLLEKGYNLDPGNPSIQHSLANVYLAMARQQPDQRQVWAEKALAVEDSPTIRQSVALLSKPDAKQAQVQRGASGFMRRSASSGSDGVKVPRSTAKLSINDMLRDMEAQLTLKPEKNSTLIARLEVLEQHVLGDVQDGPMAARTKTLYAAVMGDGTAVQDDLEDQLAQEAPSNPELSYLDEIFKVTDGKVVRWGKFPLRVYFEEPPKEVTGYQSEFKEAALQGFNIWKLRTDGFVNFVEVKNAGAADVVVHWQDAYTDRFADPEKIPSIYRTYTPPKRNPLQYALQAASMVMPGYYGLAPQALGAALQYRQIKQRDALREESHIYLGLAPARPLPAESARILIQNMAAKEFGHVLGLKGLSPKAGDLLHPVLRSDSAQEPSMRDLETLRDLYHRPPAIILNTR